MKKITTLSFSICIPVYKGSSVLKNALQSIAKQKFSNYEVIILDDNSSEYLQEIKATKKIINSFHSLPIRYVKNKQNVGSAKTIKRLAQLAKNEIIFFLAQDDILANEALQKTRNAFLLDKNIGVVTRPYFWYEEDIRKPIRAVLPYDKQQDVILSIWDGERALQKIFESVGQVSGLAYRKKLLTVPFSADIFVGHIYPFAGILKEHKCVFLKDFTVAVGSILSQSRHKKSIYSISPTLQWVNMFKKIYFETKYERIRKIGIEQITTHDEGLIQIKNYAHNNAIYNEIKIMLKENPLNWLRIRFWFFTCICLIVPRTLLIELVHVYKQKFFERRLNKIFFPT